MFLGVLTTDTYSIFALQDFACNIIGKIHSEAKKGTSPYFKKIKHYWVLTKT